MGESVAVNGCCLTVVDFEPGLTFDLSSETLARTCLGSLSSGSNVNLERALRVGDRLGGHIVQGHVDGVASVVSVSAVEGGWNVVVDVGASVAHYLVDKGSVTLDGVSLTVVSPNDEGLFEVAVIPHTWSATTLSSWVAGQCINVEFDVLVKHVERLIKLR